MYISTGEEKRKKNSTEKSFTEFYSFKLQSRWLDIAKRSLSQLLATCDARNTGWEWINHPKVLSLPILEDERWLNEERIRLEEKEARRGRNTNYVKSI